MDIAPKADQPAADTGAWTYQPPFRPANYPQHCHYRTPGDISYCIGGWQPEATQTLEVFRFTRDEHLRLTLDVVSGDHSSSTRVKLDRASATALRDALNDALQDIAQAAEDRERRESLEQIQDEMRDAGEDGPGCYYAHPDVHYVPAGQVAAKVRELEAAGARQYMVLPHPADSSADDIARAA